MKNDAVTEVEQAQVGDGYEVGSTHVLNVPPSWILAGTVKASTDTHLVLKDCIYVESIGDGYSALGSIAVAKTAKELNSAVTKCYPVPDGMTIRKDAILISVPCVRDMQPLARAGEAEAIKRVGGK